MPEVITIESKAFKLIVDKLTFLENAVKAQALNNGHSRWITEEQTILLTDLSKRRLYDMRKSGIFNFSTATGRKIKYLRKDVENYLNNNSTVRQ